MDWILFGVFMAGCISAASSGAIFEPGKWYESLNKPPWTPPNWLFPLAWTALYVLMAWAATRVAMAEGIGYAMAFWALQLSLNTLWTPVFFGLRRIRAGMVVVSGLWLSVAGTAVVFYTVDPFAGLLLVPYLTWVTIAAALNFSIMRRNPAPGAPAAA
ncbi:MAG: tryptophan-rich sensory protein [Rhodobacteraceae bacterium]|nr:tryptophan-rich sensory protein [Paracoccaceae bacterium]